MQYDMHDIPETTPSQIGIEAAYRAKDAGMNQQEVASSLGINQSQVSRIFRGKIHRHTDTLMRVCKYVDSRSLRVSAEEVLSNDLLIQAVADVWDGTELDAQVLACVIRGLRTLRGPINSKR